MKAFARKNAALVLVALLGALVTALYALSQDSEWGAQVLKALFGLSGGVTAGG
jgi:hypothetical protein